MPQYLDIADHDEDDQIQMIGKTAMGLKKKVGFVTDSEPGKADRYIKKLQERFPGIVVLSRGDGPVPDCVYVTVGPPAN